MICASSRAPKRTVSSRYSRTSVADASIASITSSSDRASAWMSSRSSGVTNVRFSRWMISCVRKSHLCSTSLISSALSQIGCVGREHLLEQPRAALQLVGQRLKIGEELLFARNQTKGQSGSPCSGRISNGGSRCSGIVADPFTRSVTRLFTTTCRCTICHGVAVNNEVLALILGGGQGSRLFPLTQHRSKPAVPIGGKYRLIDIPVSNCLHADIRRIFVLTQFNSASLNRHIAQTYRMDLFSQGFVEILAAEQTPDNPNWFQGTADAVRQAARHFAPLRRRLLPDSRRRSSVPDGLQRAGRRAHRSQRRHHDRRAAGLGRRRHRRWASSGSIASGQIVAFEEKPSAERLAEIGQSIPPGATFAGARAPTSRSSRRWASTCSRATCCSTCWRRAAPRTSAAR